MPPPLFLLAPPRSFTSLMNAMIGQHPQAFGLPELMLFNTPVLKNFWQDVSEDVGADANRRHGLLRAIAEIYGGEQSAAAIEMAIHWCGARQEASTIEIYRELRDAIEPLMIVEKSPAYTIEQSRLERINEAFPDARFLHLVRHPIPQCESTMNLNNGVFALFVNAIEYTENEAIIEPQIAWHDINLTIMDFLETLPPERCTRVRGEVLMSDPATELAKICRWIGIRDDAEAIDEMLHPERSPFACFGPMDALFGNDPNFLRRPAFRPHTPRTPALDSPVSWRADGKGLYPKVKELARYFGYE